MKKDINKKLFKDFGILLGIFIPLVWGLLLPILFGHDLRLWTLYFSTIIISLAFIYPKSLKYPYILWMYLGDFLGWINSRLILGLVFILVLQPIAFLMKILKYDPLNKELEIKNSYRETKKNYFLDLKRIF